MTGVIKLNSLICINFTLAYPRINTSLPDFELNREVLDTEEPTTHTPEQEEILDQLDAEFQQTATVEVSGKTNGFTIRKPDKKPSKCRQKAISRANTGKESDYS